MIGVQTKPDQRGIAAEFFELFKTPWEFARSGERYDVLVCTCDEDFGGSAELVLHYGSSQCAFDTTNKIGVTPHHGEVAFEFAGRRVPLYLPAVTFSESPLCLPLEGKKQESVAFATKKNQGVVVRLGYDLFDEIRHLLTKGQPPSNAASPTLDLHIALMRELIVRSGQPLIEIPPAPDGYEFTVCLTHDVDHPVLRNHCLDHTMFGFVYRATVGSVVDACRGRISLGTLGRNLWAACRLPFVYLKLAEDPWRGFGRYLNIESGLGSTFFVIPRKNQPGRLRDGSAPAKRASGYSLDDISSELSLIRAHGGEVALHGLDAWLDSNSGNTERGIVSKETGLDGIGVRMHWLYFDEQSYKVLDQAGFSYDSTFGYNETVGFRAGTAQAYRPPGAAKLIEMPLLVMDTALFYPAYLNLRPDEARSLVLELLEDVERFGGTLMINWHDRSIAPERLWDCFYLTLVNELKQRHAWLPTATRAAAWYRKRRSVKFERFSREGESLKYRATFQQDLETPGLKVRVHPPQTLGLFDGGPMTVSKSYQESVLQADTDVTMAVAA